MHLRCGKIILNLIYSLLPHDRTKTANNSLELNGILFFKHI